MKEKYSKDEGVWREVDIIQGYYAIKNDYGSVLKLQDNYMEQGQDGFLHIKNVKGLDKEFIKTLAKIGVIGAAISAISAAGAILIYREAEKKKKK